jgi:hypothetical protein
MLIEYEAVLCNTGEDKKLCVKCNRSSFRKECPYCGDKGVVLTGDAEMDAINTKIASGEMVDFSAIFPSEAFKPLKPGEQ